MILKQRTLVQVKHVWIAPHGRFQVVLTRCPAPPCSGPAAGALRGTAPEKASSNSRPRPSRWDPERTASDSGHTDFWKMPYSHQGEPGKLDGKGGGTEGSRSNGMQNKNTRPSTALLRFGESS